MLGPVRIKQDQLTHPSRSCPTRTLLTSHRLSVDLGALRTGTLDAPSRGHSQERDFPHLSDARVAGTPPQGSTQHGIHPSPRYRRANCRCLPQSTPRLPGEPPQQRWLITEDPEALDRRGRRSILSDRTALLNETHLLCRLPAAARRQTGEQRCWPPASIAPPRTNSIRADAPSLALQAHASAHLAYTAPIQLNPRSFQSLPRGTLQRLGPPIRRARLWRASVSAEKPSASFCAGRPTLPTTGSKKKRRHTYSTPFHWTANAARAAAVAFYLNPLSLSLALSFSLPPGKSRSPPRGCGCGFPWKRAVSRSNRVWRRHLRQLAHWRARRWTGASAGRFLLRREGKK